jgi:hypothetical protein
MTENVRKRIQRREVMVCDWNFGRGKIRLNVRYLKEAGLGESFQPFSVFREYFGFIPTSSWHKHSYRG